MFILLFALLKVYASPDASVGIQGRSFPMFAAESYGEVGYGQQLWGAKALPDKASPFYGFIRPAIGATSSVVVNAFRGEIEFFPISFLGVMAGYSQVHSNFEFPFFNCEEIYCRGRTERRYLEGRMALGHKGYLFMSTYRQDRLQFSQGDKQFAEFRRVIKGNPGHDVLEELRVVAGKSDKKRLLGLAHEWSRFQLSDEQSRSTFFLFQRTKTESTLMLGAGAFSSDSMGMGPILYFRYNYIILPSIKLI
jgi:hypothetical protein